MAKRDTIIIPAHAELSEQIKVIIDNLRKRGYANPTIKEASFIMSKKSQKGILKEDEVKYWMSYLRGVSLR